MTISTLSILSMSSSLFVVDEHGEMFDSDSFPRLVDCCQRRSQRAGGKTFLKMTLKSENPLPVLIGKW